MKLSDLNPDDIEEVEQPTMKLSDLNPEDIEEEDSGPSSFESGLRGAAQGASLGFADEIAGGLESLVSDKSYKQARDESRQAYRAAEDANPITYNSGQVGAGVATAFIPGLNLAKGATLAARAGQAAAMGAAAGLGSSDEEDLSGMALDTAKGAALGGALQGAGEKIVAPAVKYGAGKLGKVGGSLSAKVSDFLKNRAERSAAKAMGAERGTIKKLGVDKVQQIGRQALDEGVVTPLASTDDLISRNESLKSRVMGKRQSIYDKIDAENASTFNPQDVATQIRNEAGEFNQASPLNRGKLKKLDDSMEAILLRGPDDISMNEAQQLVRELGDAAKWSGIGKRTPEEELAQKIYMMARERLNQSAADAAETMGGKSLRGVLEGTNQKYATAKNADELLKNKFAREQGNKLFGLTDTIAGAGGLGAVGGPGTIGILAAKKGLERYGAQLTAVGADKLSKMVASSPEKFGKFAGALAKAASRGNNALAATHAILSKDPEYQKTLEELPE